MLLTRLISKRGQGTYGRRRGRKQMPLILGIKSPVSCRAASIAGIFGFDCILDHKAIVDNQTQPLRTFHYF